MKHYIPNLIPDKHRVLPDYFKEHSQGLTDVSASPATLLWNGLAIVAVLAAVAVIGIHVGFSVSLLMFAFFASSWGRRRIENGLRFQFTPKLKAYTLGALSFTSVLTGFQYRDRVDQAVIRERMAILATQKTEEAAKHKETARLDSLETFMNQAQASLKKGAYTKAIGLFNQSARFATSNDAEQQQRLHEGLATSYTRTKQYRLAILEYDAAGSLDGEQLYQQALCYQQVGRKTEALTNLLKASEAGHRPATKLYDKLNPLLRKLLYYQTVCCDGSDSPSNAKGRGACSHHGGVCNWNKPIYETYRSYHVNGL